MLPILQQSGAHRARCYPECLRSHPQFWAYAALVSVCIFWGTTYLGIRMALESFPPMSLVAVRYTISGLLMLAGALLAGVKMPSRKEWTRTSLNGIVILGIGNGCLATAETMIPSGLAALMITIGPFWMLGLDAALPPRTRLHLPTILGLVVGMSGAALLVGPGALDGGLGSNLVKGFLVLQFGCFGWSLGSLLQRRQPTEAHPIVSGAIQQLATGLAFIPIAWLVGGPIQLSGRGLGAIVYLIIFGSIVGYSSYVYALEHLPVAVLSIYNYINPVVAVILGWLVYNEPFGWREFAAMIIIFFGVAMVKRAESRRAARAA
jgi:drug/metabolite transporter (DMT)-like permease